jgi:hypothetical protein
METESEVSSSVNETGKDQVTIADNSCEDEQLIEKAKQAREFKRKHPGAIMGVFMSPSIQ